MQSSLVVGVTKMMMEFGMIPKLPFGLDMKPGVLNRIQSYLIVGVTKMMVKSVMIPTLPFGKDPKGALPKSSQSGTTAEQVTQSQGQSLGVSQLTQIASSFKSSVIKENAFDSKSGSQPDVKPQKQEDAGGSVQSDNNMHQMVLKHESNIEELVEENKKLRRMVKDLKVPSTKLEPISADVNNIPNFKGEDDTHKQNEQSENRES